MLEGMQHHFDAFELAVTGSVNASEQIQLLVGPLESEEEVFRHVLVRNARRDKNDGEILSCKFRKECSRTVLRSVVHDHVLQLTTLVFLQLMAHRTAHEVLYVFGLFFSCKL